MQGWVRFVPRKRFRRFNQLKNITVVCKFTRCKFVSSSELLEEKDKYNSLLCYFGLIVN